MPYDGNGIYNPIDPPDFPAEPGTVIRAAQYNNQILDMAQALSNCLTRDGQGEPTADISWNGFRLTSLGAAVNPADAVRLDQIAGLVDSNLADGFTINNNTAIKMKNSGGTALLFAFVGSDNNVYFCYDAVGNWFMRYNQATGTVEFSKPSTFTGNMRVVGNMMATGNVGAFQP